MNKKHCYSCKYLFLLCIFLGIILIAILIMFFNYNLELSHNKVQLKKVIEITKKIEAEHIPNDLKKKIEELKEIIDKLKGKKN